MSSHVELQKVLEVIKTGGQMELLLEWKIPYERQLLLLRLALDNNLISEEADRVFLTSEGEAFLNQPAPENPPQRDVLSRLMKDRLAIFDVYLPSELK